MTNEQAFKMIGERAEEMRNDPEVQRKMVEIAKTDGKEAAIKWLYQTAICTLAGM